MLRHHAFETFFFGPEPSRTFVHSEASALLGVSTDTLHNIIKRYASKVVKREGKGIARRYDCHALAILNWANDLFAAGIEQRSAVAFAIEIYRKLLESQVRPLVEGSETVEVVLERIENAVAIIHRGAAGRAKLSLVDGRDLAEVAFWNEGVCTTYACGKPLKALMGKAYEVGRRSRAAAISEARAEA